MAEFRVRSISWKNYRNRRSPFGKLNKPCKAIAIGISSFNCLTPFKKSNSDRAIALAPKLQYRGDRFLANITNVFESLQQAMKSDAEFTSVSAILPNTNPLDCDSITSQKYPEKEWQ